MHADVIAARGQVLLLVAFTLAALSAGPAASQPTPVVIEHREKVGDAVRAWAERSREKTTWFDNLSEVDKKSVVEELNRYTFILREEVKESNTLEGTKVWRFVSESPKTFSVEGKNDPAGPTKEIGAMLRDYEMAAGPHGDVRKCYFFISWRLRPDRGLPIKGAAFFKGTGINMPMGFDLPADPKDQAPQTQPKPASKPAEAE